MQFMKRLVSIALLLALIATLPACNTVRGVGRDIEAGGEAVQEVAE